MAFRKCEYIRLNIVKIEYSVYTFFYAHMYLLRLHYCMYLFKQVCQLFRLLNFCYDCYYYRYYHYYFPLLFFYVNIKDITSIFLFFIVYKHDAICVDNQNFSNNLTIIINVHVTYSFCTVFKFKKKMFFSFDFNWKK